MMLISNSNCKIIQTIIIHVLKMSNYNLIMFGKVNKIFGTNINLNTSIVYFYFFKVPSTLRVLAMYLNR